MAAGGVLGVPGRRPLSVLLKTQCTAAPFWAVVPLLPKRSPFPKKSLFMIAILRCWHRVVRGLSYCDSQQIFYRQHGANTVGVASQDLTGFCRRSQDAFELTSQSASDSAILSGRLAALGPKKQVRFLSSFSRSSIGTCSSSSPAMLPSRSRALERSKMGRAQSLPTLYLRQSLRQTLQLELASRRSARVRNCPDATCPSHRFSPLPR